MSESGENGPPVLEVSALSANDESTTAAVVFDPTTRQFSVVSDPSVLCDAISGSVIEHEGLSLTVIEIYDSVEEAESECKKKVDGLNATSAITGVNHIFFNGDISSATTNGSCEDVDLIDVDELADDMDTLEDTADVTAELFNAGEPSPEPEPGTQAQNAVEAVKYMFAVYYNELSEDIARLNKRQQSLCVMMQDVLGGAWVSGVVDESLSYDPKNPPLLRRLGSKRHVRPFQQPSYMRVSLDDDDEEVDNQYMPTERSQYNERKRSAALQENRDRYKRSRYEDGDDDSETYKSTNSSTNVRGGGYGGKTHPGYPFISREEEEDCLRRAKGSVANYSQRVSRLLFADSLDLYFKDQDPQRRNWIHDIIDYRFPSEDKQAQMYKWKNCSWAINKNRFGKDIPEYVPPKRPEQSHTGGDKRKGQTYKTLTGREEMIVMKPDFPYVGEAVEQEIFAQTPVDPVKYTELLAFRLFHSSLEKLFSEQDGAKKEWLRDCVDWRFPLEDKLKRDSRWKVCGAAANRNRLKHVENGEAVAYPYVTKEFEESCLRAARGNPTVYAELMGRGLFADSLDVSFKDQDPRRRIWLHDILDRRFPTLDKVKQIQKWKLCSTAINKNRTLSQAQAAASCPSPGGSTAGTTPKVEPKEVELFLDDLDKETSVSRRDSSRPASAKTPLPEEAPVKKPVKKPITDKVMEKEPTPVPKVETVRTSEATNTRSAMKAKQNNETPSQNNTPMGKTVKRKSILTIPFPFVDLGEEEEEECFKKCEGATSVYARSVAQLLFKDNLTAYFKDQEEDRKEWLRKLIDQRFPTPRKRDQELKWKSCLSAINRGAVKVEK